MFWKWCFLLMRLTEFNALLLRNLYLFVCCFVVKMMTIYGIKVFDTTKSLNTGSNFMNVTSMLLSFTILRIILFLTFCLPFHPTLFCTIKSTHLAIIFCLSPKIAHHMFRWLWQPLNSHTLLEKFFFLSLKYIFLKSYNK